MTYLQACELISRHWKSTLGIDVSPLDIFNSSPSGELWMVAVWYEEAMAWARAQSLVL